MGGWGLRKTSPMPEGTAPGGFEAFGRGGSVGLVLVHEIFGYTPIIRGVAASLAHEGFPTVAVDLYGGRTAQSLEGALAMQGALTEAHVLAMLDRARGEVSARLDPGARVGAIGFSMGGGYALLGACRLPFDFCIDSYGRIEHPQEVNGLRGPLLLILASDDEKVTGWAFSALLPALNHAKRRVDVQVYPQVRHAFQRPGWEGHEDRAANDAWKRTLEFLARVRSETGYLPSAEAAASAPSPALSSGPPTRSHP